MSKKKKISVDKQEGRCYNVLPQRMNTRSVSLAAKVLYPRWFREDGKYYIEEQPWMGGESDHDFCNWGCWAEIRNDPRQGIKYTGRRLVE